MKTETITTAEEALSAHFGIDLEDVQEERHDHYGLPVYSADGGEYAVGTDSEADDAWDKALDSYLEECVYPELKEPLSRYFDSEAWKSDARYDGRGHALSSYDGDEIELPGGFVAFRVN